MKKSIKRLIMAISVCAISAFAVIASGCKIKQSINELRCDHVMIDDKVTKEPTCQEEGEIVKKCNLCTYSERQVLDKLEHTIVILEKVPAYGANSFREALQSFRIIHFGLWLEGNYHNTVGRFDKWMYPYLKADMEKGLYTPESALELLEDFFISSAK